MDPEEFCKYDWTLIKQHIQNQYEAVAADISVFVATSPIWMGEVDSGWTDIKPKTAIVCQFWLKADKRCERPQLESPKRAGYIMRHEQEFLKKFLKTITCQSWYNLKAVWKKSEVEGMITIHFKVDDYEPFLFEKMVIFWYNLTKYVKKILYYNTYILRE